MCSFSNFSEKTLSFITFSLFFECFTFHHLIGFYELLSFFFLYFYEVDTTEYERSKRTLLRALISGVLTMLMGLKSKRVLQFCMQLIIICLHAQKKLV